MAQKCTLVADMGRMVRESPLVVDLGMAADLGRMVREHPPVVDLGRLSS